MSEQNLPLDYFSFYEIPVQFHPNLETIKQRFYAFSKKFHPDFYANDSDEKQQEVLDLSTLNNKAYQVLSNPTKRLKYVLELKGIVETDEGYQLPQDFLMDMMEVNEALMDLKFEPNPEKLQQVKLEFQAMEERLNNELNHLTNQFDENPGHSADLLSAIKDIYYRQKYILRIKEQLPKA